MSTAVDVLAATLRAGIEGEGAHTKASSLLDGLDWRTAGRQVPDCPYTIQQLANHVIWWNGYCIAGIRGENPTPPTHAVDGWPGPEAPKSEADWIAFVAAYKGSLAALAAELDRGDLTAQNPGGRRVRADSIRAMANHVSYHGGQIALVRRMLGAWPPPGGGDTW